MFFKQSFNKLHFSHFSSDFLAQLANKAGTDVANVKNVIIWGNHSSTQFPDAAHATINGKMAAEVINDADWFKTTFLPTVQKRGAVSREKNNISIS